MKKIKEWLQKLINAIKPPKPAPVTPPKEPTFVDNFSKLDTSKWTVSTWTAPTSSEKHRATFLAKNVSFDEGMLCLKLNQVTTAAGVTSKGAEIASNELFHYGTFEWEMRASSTAAHPSETVQGKPVPGSISGCFIYADNASTEIDFEIEGNERCNLTQTTSWVGESNPNENNKILNTGMQPHEGFITYKFVWKPGVIEFYQDDKLISKHTKVVPSGPAKVMINHWGTNSPNWGGAATTALERYMWVRSFKYTPL